jgi:hypothetical protein
LKIALQDQETTVLNSEIGQSEVPCNLEYTLFFPGKLQFMRFHINAATAETHSFRLQSQALLDCRISGELDLSACAQYPLPGQSE